MSFPFVAAILAPILHGLAAGVAHFLLLLPVLGFEKNKRY